MEQSEGFEEIATCICFLQKDRRQNVEICNKI